MKIDEWHPFYEEIFKREFQSVVWSKTLYALMSYWISMSWKDWGTMAETSLSFQHINLSVPCENMYI